MARPRLVPLKPKSEIDGVRLERVVSVAPSMLIYDGVDTSSDDRVVVREYFPAAIATREAGGSGVQPAGAADMPAFEAGLNGFVDHGRALYPFRHKNVVALRAVVEANGTAYLISDHVDGALLDDLLEPGDALVVDEIEEILPGLLDGLAALHHSRLLHRGVAPGTILIRRDGAPILDLPLPAPGADDVAPPSLAPYVAADWQDAGADARGDIYGLGATLYRLVTGHEPEMAAERAAIAAAGGTDREAAALAALGNMWPRTLRDTIAACLMPAPGRRPGSVTAVRDLLEGTARAAPPAARPPEPSPAPETGAAPPGRAADAEGHQPPTEPRRGRPAAENATQPATGVERTPRGNGPRMPDEVSTVWLGSGGARPTELPRQRTERPVPVPPQPAPTSDEAAIERSSPTLPGTRPGAAASDRSEPSFRPKATAAPARPAAPAAGDEPPTVRIDRTDVDRPPTRAPKGDDSVPTKLFRRREPSGRPGPSPTEAPTAAAERSAAKPEPEVKPETEVKPEPAAAHEQEEPATVPYRREREEEDDAPREGEAAGVIYRKGEATPVRAPLKPSLVSAPGAAPDDSPSSAPVVPAALSVIAPAGLPARGWRDLVVFLHDPGLATLVAKHIEDNPAPGAATTAKQLEAQNLIVRPGTPLRVVPSIESGRANPGAITLGWNEIFHRLDFRIAADPGASPDAGVVRLFLGPILLAEADLDLSGDPDGVPVRSAVRGFRAPFFSYVAGDAAVVEPLGAAAAHLRAPATARAMKRRETPWDRDILPLIEEADGLFIFWSAEASRSPNLRKEWEFALELHGPEFIRLISWVDPMPAPPMELNSVPIIRLTAAQTVVPV